MSNLSMSEVQRKKKNDPEPTLSENFNSHTLPTFVFSLTAIVLR
jgi:hypothetical protein